MKVQIILGILLATHSMAIAQDAASLPTALRQKMDVLVETAMEKRGIPGLTVAVAVRNELRYSRGFGLADVENKVAARADTRYRTASIAKPMTSVVVMSLVEAGKIDLDAPVQRYCGDYPDKRWPLTPRQVLGHLGGVRHYKSRDEANSTQHFFDLKTALATFADDPLLHEPGTRFQYSSFGYSLLGSIAEGASGLSYLKLLEKTVLTPAGMSLTRSDDHFAIIAGRTRGYIRPTAAQLATLPDGHNFQAGKLYNATLHDTSMKIPGGGLLSTAPDLVRFAIAVNKHEILGEKSLETMWTRQSTRDGKLTRYALGWSIGELGGRKIVSHGGGQSGTSTYLLLIPKSGTVVAVMCNLQNADVGSLARSMAKVIE